VDNEPPGPIIAVGALGAALGALERPGDRAAFVDRTGENFKAHMAAAGGTFLFVDLRPAVNANPIFRLGLLRHLPALPLIEIFPPRRAQLAQPTDLEAAVPDTIPVSRRIAFARRSFHAVIVIVY
jgi:hypothetical protein